MTTAKIEFELKPNTSDGDPFSTTHISSHFPICATEFYRDSNSKREEKHAVHLLDFVGVLPLWFGFRGLRMDFWS